ncbi:hypothetical protein JQ612_20845 [Bradyrhizobium manausense]|uniref:hypothetical protein n=1 Tax=Bradyrhizobium manausense TaxID=989370 RepID=UPI001BAB1277|nr:hypothetical protein [Bradyrhizobium manausense]MBR0687445.1 hypothetical protein [Bradyrhizobium manausense]MBR0835643.1 hypothetical protein [Bradyrhizobium manausense]
MLRTRICLAAMLLAASVHVASAQTAAAPATTAPAAATEAKPGKIKLTMQKLKDMKAKWSANKPKLKACRGEVKSKGLTGDDRWFYIEECMNKS